MIIATVRFPLKPGMTLEEVAKLYEGYSVKYQGMPGLLMKYYVYGDDGRGGAIYFWESREAAEKQYSAEWRKGMTERWGSAPAVELMENPVTVDNVTKKGRSAAA